MPHNALTLPVHLKSLDVATNNDRMTTINTLAQRQSNRLV